MWIGSLRWWRAALFVALALAGLVAAASWIALRVWGPALSREQLESALSDALGQPVHVGAVHLKPWRLRASLDDVDVPAPPTSPSRTRLRAARIDVDVDIASVWRREITLSAIGSDVDFEITVPASDTAGPSVFPLPAFFRIGPIRIGIGSVRVTNAHAVIHRAEPAVTVELTRADLAARPIAGDLELSGRLDTLSVDAIGRHEQIDGVALDGRLSADLVRIRHAGWRWQGESMALEGEVRRPWDETRELSLRVNGDLSLAAVARATDLDAQVTGTARVSAEVAGRLPAPQVRGQIRIRQLGLADLTIDDVAVDGRWADRTLRLEDIRARMRGTRVTGRLEAGPIRGGAANVALALREIVLPGDWAGLGVGTARADGRFRDGGLDLHRAEVNWRGIAASLDGRIARGAQALRVRLSADLQELGRAMPSDSISGRVSASAELSGRGDGFALEGHTDIVDVAAGGHAIEPISASFRSRSSPGLITRWEATIDAPRVAWNHVTAEDVTASLVVDAQRLELTRLRARVAAIPADGTGQWQWTGTGRAHVALGPVSLAALPGVPSSAFHVGGAGRAAIDATIERGVASGRALVELEQVTAGGISLGSGRSEVRAQGRALDGELSFPSRRLTARGTGRLEAGAALTARVDLDDLALQPVLRELGSAAADHVDGRVSARADVSVPVDQPSSARAVVHVTPDRLRLLGEPWTSQGSILLRWEPPRLLVERFRLDGPSGNLSVAGALVGPDGRGLSVALDNARLPGALAEQGRGTVRAAVRIDSGSVELTRLEAKWPRLAAIASGHVLDNGSIAFSGRVDADIAALAPAVGLRDVSGRVVLSADARGRRDAIEATGSVQASRVELRGATVTDVELPFRLSRSTLRVPRGRARLGTSRVSADVSATWTGSAPITAATISDVHVKAEASAPAARLEDVAALLPAALNGRGELAVTAHAEGTPRAWRGNASLTSPVVELPAGPLRQLRAELALDQTRLAVTDLRVDAFGMPARATGTWAWAGGGSVKATLGPVPLARLAMVPAGAGLEGTGRASLDAVVRSAADVSGSAHATFDDVAIAGVRLGRGQLDASGSDGAFVAELAFPEQRLRATSRARVDGGNILRGELTLPAIDLATLRRAFAPAPVTLGGTLSARASARVPLADPRLGDGVVTIDPVRLVVASETWESRGPIQVRWAGGALSLEAFRLAADDAVVTGQGTLGAQGKLDARLTGQLPLSMFREMQPEIRELGGVLDVALRATGTVAAPAFAGEGAIRGGSLLLRDRPETVRDLEARFSVSSQGVQLREATAAFSGGRVQARGDLALRGWEPGPYRVRLHADNVALGQVVEGFSSAWNADLELAGLTGQAQLTGRARLVRGLYNRDLSIVSLVMSPSRAVAAETGTPLRLRVRVDLDDNLVVRTRAVNLRAGGVLDVEGTTSRPVIFGSIESRDGRIVFRGRDWRVSSAAVRFADPRRLDPYVDVLATSRIAEYDVTMQVSGPVSNVNVRFSSTPRLSQNDLLSLVAFGATGADLKESPGTVLLGEAGKLLAQNVLGVNPAASGLRISTGSSGGSSASELHGFPGEERSIASRTTPGTRKDTVRVEYQLWAPLYLSGEYDREGGYGTDVVLRFRFR